LYNDTLSNQKKSRESAEKNREISGKNEFERKVRWVQCGLGVSPSEATGEPEGSWWFPSRSNFAREGNE